MAFKGREAAVGMGMAVVLGGGVWAWNNVFDDDSKAYNIDLKSERFVERLAILDVTGIDCSDPTSQPTFTDLNNPDFKSPTDTIMILAEDVKPNMTAVDDLAAGYRQTLITNSAGYIGMLCNLAHESLVEISGSPDADVSDRVTLDVQLGCAGPVIESCRQITVLKVGYEIHTPGTE